MGQTAVVLGADSLFGALLCEELLRQGWTVFGGVEPPAGESEAQQRHSGRFRQVAMDAQSTDSLLAAAREVGEAAGHIDVLISCLDDYEPDSPAAGLDFGAMMQAYERNALGPLRFMETFLPLTGEGMKRLCFVTSGAGFIGGDAKTGDDIGYSMAKSALHMSVKIMYNHLGKDGYTFRLYVPGEQRVSQTAPETREAAVRHACSLFTKQAEEPESGPAIADYTGASRRL